MTRVDELTDRLLSDTLADDEWAELESLLASDPEARAAHLALLELEAALRGLRTEFDLTAPTLERIREAQAEKTTAAVMAAVARQPAPLWSRPFFRRPSWKSRGGFMAMGLLATAAALLVGLWLGGSGSTDSPLPEQQPSGNEFAAAPPATARLISSLGSVELLTPQGEVLPMTEGREVPSGHTLRTVGEDSLARVEMPDRTTVDLAPDSIVRFIALGTATTKPRLFLAAGQVTAAVPDGVTERQLVIGTGVAEVFARTGIFMVSSAGPESTRVDVKKGNVDVVRMDARTRIPVGRGAAFVQAGFERVVIEPTARIDRTPSRSLVFPNPRDAVFSRDGHEVWVASPRQWTRWTRDGGTADLTFAPHKGGNLGPVACFARDASALVTSSGIAASGRDEKLQIRTLPRGDLRVEFPLKLPDHPRLWTVAPNAAWLAAADGKANPKRLRIFDGGTGSERSIRDFDEVVGCVASSFDGDVLAVALNDTSRVGARVALLDPRTGSRTGTLPTQRKGCSALAFSPDRELLAAGFNGLVQVWNVQTRELVKSMTGFERAVTCLAFSPNGKLLATGMQDGQVWLWSLASGKAIQLIDVGSRGVRCVAFHPNGKSLLIVAANAPVGLWKVADATGSAEVQ